jgi:hypothetical protein
VALHHLSHPLLYVIWGQCYKIVAVIFHGNFNPTFSRAKILWSITEVFRFATLGQCYKTFYQGCLLPFYVIYHNNNVL